MSIISEKPIILVGIEYCEVERSLLSTAEIITVLVVLTSILMVKVDPQNYKQGFRAGYHVGLDSVFRQNRYTLISQHKIGHPGIRTISMVSTNHVKKIGLDLSSGGGYHESMDVGLL